MRVLFPLTAVSLVLGGCGSSAGPKATSSPAPVNMGLNALATGEPAPTTPPPALDPRSEGAWDQAALDLEQLLAEAGAEAGRAPAGPPAPVQPSTAPSAATPAGEPPMDAPSADAENAEAAAVEAPVEEVAPVAVPAPAESLDARIERLSNELTQALRDRARAGGVGDLLRLGLLEALQPGALGTGATPDASLTAILAPEEIAQIVAARDVARSWLAAFERGSSEEALRAIEAGLEAVGKASPTLRITTVSLCQRVDGYASYTPFVSTTFVAGQPHDVIVYTELDRFTHRPVRFGDPLFNPGDTLATEISQLLTLYHEGSGDLQAWHQPRATVVTTSRRERKECFLVNQITLPANLSVGNYRLKVLTRDEVSGAEAEAFLPISVVADARLAQEPGR